MRKILRARGPAGPQTSSSTLSPGFPSRSSTLTRPSQEEVSSPRRLSQRQPPSKSLPASSEEDFLRHSPIKRAKYCGWLRNLCVAMGNSGNARFIPKLKELPPHPDPIIPEHPRRATRQSRGQRTNVTKKSWNRI